MSTGIPSENLSIPSFMAFPIPDCAVATTVAVTTGMNGRASFSIVPAASSRRQD